jgi:hypothetical protein
MIISLHHSKLPIRSHQHTSNSSKNTHPSYQNTPPIKNSKKNTTFPNANSSQSQVNTTKQSNL